MGTGSSGYAAVAIAPTFSREAIALYQASNLVDMTIDNARLRLTRLTGAVARDATIPIAPDQDSLITDMVVPINGPTELLTALLELRNGNQVLFSGTGVVLAVAGGQPSIPVIPMLYVGPVDAVVSQLVLVTTGLTGIVGQLLGQALTVQALTADGAPVAGVPIAWSVLGGGASVGSPSGVTDASGLASTPVTLGTLAGTQTIQAAANGVTPVVATLSALAGPAALLEIVQQPASFALVGVALATQPIVRLLDQYGNAVSAANVPVVASLLGSAITLGGPTTTFTNQNGVASFGGLSLTGLLGTTSMLFNSGQLTSATSNPITLGSLPSAVSKLVPVSGGLSGTVGQLLGQPVAVKALTDGDAPVAGVPIAWSVLSGGASVGDASSVTDATGLASTPVTLGTLAGVQTVQAATDGIEPLVQNISAVADEPSQLEIVRQPSSSALLGAVLTTQPIVRLVDQYGNGSGVADVPVVASLTGGGISLLGSNTAFTNASGVASFSGLALTGLLGSTSMLFSSSGLSSATSNPISLGLLGAAKPSIRVRDSATLVTHRTHVPKTP